MADRELQLRPHSATTNPQQQSWADEYFIILSMTYQRSKSVSSMGQLLSCSNCNLAARMENLNMSRTWLLRIQSNGP